MEALPEQYKGNHISFVEEWFKKQKERFFAEATEIREKPHAYGLWYCWPMGAMLACLGLIIVPGMFSKGQVLWGALCSLVASLGLAWGVAGIVVDSRGTKKILSAKQQEWDENRLRRRAELIILAARAFYVHCRLYEAFYERVRDGMQPEDPNAESRYLTFLSRNFAVIKASVGNFCRVVETMSYMEKQRQKYPELTAQNDTTSLAALMEQLNEPFEPPPIFGLALEPLAALEHEERLQEIIDMAADPTRGLDARIAEALGESEPSKSAP